MNPTTRRTATLLTLLAILTAAPDAHAQPDPATVRESVVQIAVMDDNDIRRVGSGFAIADGYLLTAAHLVAGEDRIVAVPLTTRAELLARVVYANERADLALLSVNGLTTPPLKLASDGFEAGRLVYSVGAWDPSGEPLVVASAEDDVPLALSEGSVGAHDDLPAEGDAPAVPLLEHNAMIPAAGYGGPLLNECGEVAGLNRGSLGVSARRLRRGQAPEGVVHALRAPAIATLLEPHSVEAVTSDASCESALAAAQAEAEAAAAQLEQSRQELEEATGEAEQTREELERTQQEKEEAAARAAEAQSRVGALESRYEEAVQAGDEQAEALRAELEAARGEQDAARSAVGTLEGELAALEERLRQEAAADRMRLIMIGVAAGVGVLILGIVGIVLSRRRNRQLALAREEAKRAHRAAADARAGALEEGESPYPDCVLTGETGDGHPVSVKVSGRLLGGEGAVIGRSPRNATLLIDDRTLSREHARLFADGDALYLEDLGSTNGTRVNGRAVEPGTPTAVSHGDRLELGAVKVELLVGE